MDIYFIYLLRCRGGILYTGITTDPARRFWEHFERGARSAKFTRSHRAERVEALWRTQGREAASRLEYRIKRMAKPQKERLIREPDCLQALMGDKLDASLYTIITEPELTDKRDLVYNKSINKKGRMKKMKKIRAVLMDMDGTLLGTSQVAVSMRNMAAVQKAIGMGIKVIPCTGRVFDMMPPQLLTQPGLRYFITSHGARVYDRDTGKSIYEDLIPAEECAKLMEMLEGKGLYNEVAADATIYFEKSVTEPFDMNLVPVHHVWYVRDNCHTAVEKPSAYFRENNIGLEKMNIYGIPDEMQQEIYDAVTATGSIGHTRPGAGPNLEFLHKGLDKLKAVDVVLKELGISYEETLAIGDSSSDLEIIKACGVGIAMGNAPDNIKAAADDVTDLNTEDGLAKAFEKYLW